MKFTKAITALSCAASLLQCNPANAFAPAACTANLNNLASTGGTNNHDVWAYRRSSQCSPALSASASSMPPLSGGATSSSSLDGSSISDGETNNSPAVAARQLTLYNSLIRGKEPFIPQSSNTVSMYTCGPTVYDSAHVGNFRAFLTYDVLKRVLVYLGYDVDHICNLTDVDDKIIKRCDRDGRRVLIGIDAKVRGQIL